MKDFMEMAGLVFAGVALFVGVAVLAAVLTWFLWNFLMPEIFGLPKIGLWQALGMNVLAGILFKSSSSSCNCSK